MRKARSAELLLGVALVLFLVAKPAPQFPTHVDSSGTSKSPVACDQQANGSAVGAATVQLVALASGKSIYVCSYVLEDTAGAGTGQFQYGTGTTCSTGTVNMTAQYSFAVNGALVQGDGVGTVLRTIAGQAFCLKNTVASTTVVATVSFAQF